MNDQILNKIRGQKISRFVIVADSFETHRVILELESGPKFEFKSGEFKFGRYEAYTLEIGEYDFKIDRVGDGLKVLSIDAGWTVGETDVYERQDWLKPADSNVKTIGNNPVTHSYGPIGAAPTDATHIVVVIASVILVSNKCDRHAMISLANFPGFISFTSDAREIASVREHYGRYENRH